MDNFEAYIMDKLNTRLSTVMSKDNVPNSFINIKSEATDRNVAYLYNNFENENGKLWNRCKQVVSLLYENGQSKFSRKEYFISICETAMRNILNKETPKGYSLFTEISQEGIEWINSNIKKKIENFATEKLENTKKVELMPFEGCIVCNMPLNEALENKLLIEKLSKKYKALSNGVKLASDDDIAVNYFFSFINSLDNFNETFSENLILPLNETFAVNLKDSEILIRKIDNEELLTDEMEVYEFLKSFQNKLEKNRTNFRVIQDDYNDFKLTENKYCFEKDFEELNPTYLKELTDYIDDLDIVITDKEKKIEYIRCANTFSISMPDKYIPKELERFIENIDNCGYFNKTELRIEPTQKFVPLENFKRDSQEVVDKQVKKVKSIFSNL